MKGMSPVGIGLIQSPRSTDIRHEVELIQFRENVGNPLVKQCLH
jgi:hypothetical protein